MKASELIVGDWVKSSYGNIGKVESIEKTFGSYNIGVRYSRRKWDVFDVKELNPIPLTEEILNANGIQCRFGNPWYQFENEIHICSKDRKQIIEAECKYVHELQHALRLCGFSELADNFKI